MKTKNKIKNNLYVINVNKNIQKIINQDMNKLYII